MSPSLALVVVVAVHAPAAAPARASGPGTAGRLSIWVSAASTGDRLASKEPVPLEPLPQPDEVFPTVVVDPDKRFQVIEGIGGALTDAAAETFARLPRRAQERLLTA